MENRLQYLFYSHKPRGSFINVTQETRKANIKNRLNRKNNFLQLTHLFNFFFKHMNASF